MTAGLLALLAAAGVAACSNNVAGEMNGGCLHDGGFSYVQPASIGPEQEAPHVWTYHCRDGAVKVVHEGEHTEGSN